MWSDVREFEILWIQGGRLGDRPTKTSESNIFHHDSVHFGKQHSRYKAILPSDFLSQQYFDVYFSYSSEPVMRLEYQISLKLPPSYTYWLDPPTGIREVQYWKCTGKLICTNFRQKNVFHSNKVKQLFWWVKPVWSNYRPAGRVWPATAFSLARRSIQEKSSNLRFLEKACVFAFVSLSCLRRIKCIFTRTMNATFSVYHLVLFLYFKIILEGRPAANPTLGQLSRLPLCFFSVARLSLSWGVHLAQWALYS